MDKNKVLDRAIKSLDEMNKAEKRYEEKINNCFARWKNSGEGKHPDGGYGNITKRIQGLKNSISGDMSSFHSVYGPSQYDKKVLNGIYDSIIKQAEQHLKKLGVKDKKSTNDAGNDEAIIKEADKIYKGLNSSRNIMGDYKKLQSLLDKTEGLYAANRIGIYVKEIQKAMMKASKK